MPLPSGEGTSETLVLCVSSLRTVAMTPLQDQPPNKINMHKNMVWCMVNAQDWSGRFGCTGLK